MAPFISNEGRPGNLVICRLYTLKAPPDKTNLEGRTQNRSASRSLRTTCWPVPKMGSPCQPLQHASRVPQNIRNYRI
jgi:hypothetical protein